MGLNGWFVLFLIAIVAAANVGEETGARLKLLLFVANKPYCPDLPATLKKLYEDIVHAHDVNPTTPQCELEAGVSDNPNAVRAIATVESDVEPREPIIPSYPVTKCRALFVLQLLRASMNLLVVCTVPLFVIRDKSDPVSLILNTLSVLFVLEVDDLCTVFLGKWATDPAVLEPYEVHQIEADEIERHKLAAMYVTLVVVMFVWLARYMELSNDVLHGIESGWVSDMPIYLYVSYLVSSYIIASPTAILLKLRLKKKIDPTAGDKKYRGISELALSLLTQAGVYAFFFMNYQIAVAAR